MDARTARAARAACETRLTVLEQSHQSSMAQVQDEETLWQGLDRQMLYPVSTEADRDRIIILESFRTQCTWRILRLREQIVRIQQEIATVLEEIASLPITAPDIPARDLFWGDDFDVSGSESDSDDEMDAEDVAFAEIIMAGMAASPVLHEGQVMLVDAPHPEHVMLVDAPHPEHEMLVDAPHPEHEMLVDAPHPEHVMLVVPAF
jgi:hypothetical protein